MFEPRLHRTPYVEPIRAWVGKPVISALIGMRQTGKSFLLRQAAAEVAAAGVPAERIHFFDMESLANDSLRTAGSLHSRLADAVPGAVFIDEVQEIVEWERLTASLRGAGWDVWLTGSNAHLLSTELATLLTGRYVEIPVHPLGLAEYTAFRRAFGASASDDWSDHLRLGGLPGLAALGWQPALCQTYLEGVFDSVLLKDVVSRYQVRNVSLLQRLMRFVASSVGSPFSALSVVRFLKSQKANASVETIQAYLEHLAAACLVHPVPRWDIRGKAHLALGEKYSLGDVGLFSAILGGPGDVNAVLENLVLLELRRRGAQVSSGRDGELEVDFVAQRSGEQLYVQVGYLVGAPETLERETRALVGIRDHHPKVVLSLDPLPIALPDGLRHVDLRRFSGGRAPSPRRLGLTAAVAVASSSKSKPRHRPADLRHRKRSPASRQ